MSIDHDDNYISNNEIVFSNISIYNPTQWKILCQVVDHHMGKQMIDPWDQTPKGESVTKPETPLHSKPDKKGFSWQQIYPVFSSKVPRHPEELRNCWDISR